jgi:hypothetical protein
MRLTGITMLYHGLLISLTNVKGIEYWISDVRSKIEKHFEINTYYYKDNMREILSNFEKCNFLYGIKHIWIIKIF